jgi:tetratricopeptide (TPR) repeat protein
MTHGAQQLLSLLSILPDGLSDADLRQSGLPIENVLACKSTLIQVALAHVDNNQCLKSLVPVREYIQRVHPPSLNLKIPLHQHLHDILCVGENLWVEPDNLPQVMKMAGNFHTVLSYAIVDDPPTQWEVTLESVIHFNQYLRLADRGGSSLMVELWPQVVQHPGTANYGLYFSELLRLASIMLVPIDVEACIELGNHHFNGEPPSESKCESFSSVVGQEKTNYFIGQWYYRLSFFHYRRNRLGDALHYCELALSLAQDETSIMHSIILLMTSQLLRSTGVHKRALSLAQKAQHISELIGEKRTGAMAIRIESSCQVALGNLLRAEKLCREAPEQHSLEEYLPDVLLTKTEYLEARVLLVKILDYRSSCRPPMPDTVMCHINLATIAIEMGDGVGVINHHLDAVRMQCTTFVVYPLGILWCDSLTANIHLQQGNIQLAQQTLKKCLNSAQKDKDPDITDYCLLLLADIQHGLSSYRETERWAVISLAFGMTATNRVTTTKALRCIGDLLAIDGDSDTALNLFMAVLDSFTAMDIHRARADCMVRMAAIFEQQGDIRKTVDLLQRARPLYERSSQEKEIIKIDTKLHDVKVLSEDLENPLQKLEKLKGCDEV